MNVCLGGGGAKGFVHVGVLDALVRRGYTVRSIVGTSIGAIVGSLFAYNAEVRYAGSEDPQAKAVQALKDVFAEKNFVGLFDFNWKSPIRRGPVRGAKVLEWLEEQLHDPIKQEPIRFLDLPFDLHIMVTNYQTGDSIDLCKALCRGTTVASAVRASMSIQGVFPEAVIDCGGSEIKCWDGGTTGNCRFDRAHRLAPSRLTVASSLTYRGEPTQVRSGFMTGFLHFFRISNRSADIWLRQIETITAELLGPAMDNILVVRPDLGGVDTMTFRISARQRRRLFDNGVIATDAALDGYEGRV